MIEVVVANRRLETPDIVRLELVRADGAPLPSFTAGAHVDVECTGGLLRQYSLLNAPRETHRYVIGVLRETASRGGSLALHARGVGERLRISAPRNHFPLATAAPHHLLFAGGIGVTPILSMAQQLLHGDAAFEAHYCARSAAAMGFRGYIEDAGLSAHVQLHVDDGAGAQRLDVAAVLAGAPAGAHLYVCGPAGFIAHVLEHARAQGWAETRLHREFFAARASTDTDDSVFSVSVPSRGLTLCVPPGRSITQVLADAGIALPTSCEAGACGSCLTRVIDGEPDHRDVYLTDAERAANDQILPCCSRSRSALLVLDL